MKKFIAAVFVALSAVTALGCPPVRADSSPPQVGTFAHWPQYRWAGKVQSLGVRALWISDRTGDPYYWQMLNEMAGEWNTYYANAQSPWLPRVAVLQEWNHTGDCNGQGTPWIQGGIKTGNNYQYSLATLCMTEQGFVGNAEILGQTLSYGGINQHATLGFPMISMDLIWQHPYEVLKQALRHEFGHLLGLEHSTLVGSTMYPSGCGPVCGFTSDTIAGLNNFYAYHPMD